MHLQTATGILKITQWDAMMMMATVTEMAMTSISKGKSSNDGCSNDGDNNDGSIDVSDDGVCPIRNVDLNRLEAGSMKVDKERELMLLQAAAHIKIARAQRALYQAKVADAVADATARNEHLVRRYTFLLTTGSIRNCPCTTKSSPAACITLVL
jgi:hypothetical protein